MRKCGMNSDGHFFFFLPFFSAYGNYVFFLKFKFNVSTLD